MNRGPIDREIEMIPMLHAVPRAARQSMLSGLRRRRFTHHEPLFLEGGTSDHFLFPTTGWVKLSKAHASGRSVIVCLVGPGQLICGNAVYAGAPYCCTAVTATKQVVILSLPRGDLLSLMERFNGVTRGLLDAISCRGMRLCHRIEEVTSGTVERRLAALFLRFVPTVTEVSEVTLPFTLTRQELADLCGTTVETAIRTMRRLQAEKIVETTKTGFIITNLAQLRSLAGELEPR